MNFLSSSIDETPVKSADLDQTFVASYAELGDGFQTPEPPTSTTNAPEPPTIDRFSRNAIDKAFGAGTSSKGFNKTGQKTGKVATSSPAVKAGLVRTCLDGSTDQRSTAVKQGLVIVDQDGEVVKVDSLLCSEQIVLTKSGNVSQTSAAVKSGLVKLTKDDKVDLRSSAVQRRWLSVDENGDVDVKNSALCQKLHLKETNGAHIHGFEIADQITQLSGQQYTKEETVRMVAAINEDSNVRTKTRGGNMSNAITAPKGSGDLAVDREIAAALKDAKGGKAVQLTKHVAQRAEKITNKILSGDFPVEFKEAARELFSKLTNENGHKIVRSNAKVTTPDGADAYHVSTKAEPAAKTVAKNLVGAFEDAASTADTTRKDEQRQVREQRALETQKQERAAEKVVEQQREADRQRAVEQQRELEKKRDQERRREVERQIAAEQQREVERQHAAERQREADRQQRAIEQQRENARVAAQERAAVRASEERRQRERQASSTPSYGSYTYTSPYVTSLYSSPYSPYSGSFSGHYHCSSGSANGSALFTGPRGGTYYINSNGNKSYV